MEGRDGMRAADSDRQAIAERLRGALDEGRLNLHEYDERLQRAYAARTYGELDNLVRDLPTAGAVVPTSGAVPAQRAGGGTAASTGERGVTARWLVDTWEPWLYSVGIVVTIWALTSLAAGDLLYFWPGWVAGPWGVVVLVQTLTGLATGEPQRWAAERDRRAEKKVRERARKALRRGTGDGQGAVERAGGRTDPPSRDHDLHHPVTGTDSEQQRRTP